MRIFKYIKTDHNSKDCYIVCSIHKLFSTERKYLQFYKFQLRKKSP